MVSPALVKLSSPVARSFLIAIGVALVVDALLTFFAASQYPYLIAYTDQLYIENSRTISFVYSALGIAALLLTITTAVASIKSATNFVLVHAFITGVFLPVIILIYFTSMSSRYKVADYAEDYRQMILEYRVASHKVVKPSEGSATSEPAGEFTRQPKLGSFINLIDTIQSKFLCCGVESGQDWAKAWADYLPPTCCKEPQRMKKESWVRLFAVEQDHEFLHCSESNSYHLGCLAALKEDEQSKFSWLSNLVVFLMLLTIADTIVSLLLFGLSKTESMPQESTESELAMVGVSLKPRPSQPEITAMRHRPSVVQTLGGPNKEQIAAISHAVRFNLSNSSPRGSVGGVSKFSAATRRGSAFV